MTIVKKITLLPILVLIIFIAFSLRIVDVISGVMTISAAYAETKTAEPPKQLEKEKPAEKTEEKKPEPEKEKSEKSAAAEATNKKPEEKKAVDVPKWTDATDADGGNADVRMELLKDLSKRRAELDKREKELMTREALLRTAQTELEDKYQQLSTLRKEIEALLVQQSDEEKARTSSLVKIYESMKPKEAARIFDSLDLDILVSVASQMSERRLSPILASMNPERARTVTIMLAEQKQLPSLSNSGDDSTGQADQENSGE